MSGLAVTLLVSTVVHYALILLPGFALCVFGLRKGVHDTILAGLIALAGIGISGYLAFWLWFIAPWLGRAFSFSLPIAAAAFSIWMFQRLDIAGRRTLHRLLTLLALPGVAALLVLCAGLLFGGSEHPQMTARTRFSHALPPDNEIPFLFADGIEKAHVPKPFLGEWHTSDRPPLQTGIVLSQFVYLPHPRELEYTVISVICQSLWIFAVWLFLAAFDVNSKCIALALAVCLFSGFTFLNSFYVWPKLLAAAFMIGASAVLLPSRFAVALRSGTFLAVLAAVLSALALLAHGAAAFSILAVALTAILLKRRIGVKLVILMGAVVFSLYLPWTLYQKFFDPPGDRLLKWHLAGVILPDSRSFLQDLAASYKQLTFDQFLQDKSANLDVIADHQTEYWRHILEMLTQLRHSDARTRTLITETAAGLRGISFFFFVPNLAFLILGPISLLRGVQRRFRSQEWRIGAITWLYVALTVGVWLLLLFLPGTTWIVTSSYAMVLLAYAGSILALWAVSPWLAILLGALQIELNFLLYGAFMNAEGSIRWGTAGLGLLSLIGMLLLLRSVAHYRSEPTAKRATYG